MSAADTDRKHYAAAYSHAVDRLRGRSPADAALITRYVAALRQEAAENRVRAKEAERLAEQRSFERRCDGESQRLLWAAVRRSLTARGIADEVLGEVTAEVLTPAASTPKPAAPGAPAATTANTPTETTRPAAPIRGTTRVPSGPGI